MRIFLAFFTLLLTCLPYGDFREYHYDRPQVPFGAELSTQAEQRNEVNSIVNSLLQTYGTAGRAQITGQIPSGQNYQNAGAYTQAQQSQPVNPFTQFSQQNYGNAGGALGGNHAFGNGGVGGYGGAGSNGVGFGGGFGSNNAGFGGNFGGSGSNGAGFGGNFAAGGIGASGGSFAAGGVGGSSFGGNFGAGGVGGAGFGGNFGAGGANGVGNSVGSGFGGNFGAGGANNLGNLGGNFGAGGGANGANGGSSLGGPTHGGQTLPLDGPFRSQSESGQLHSYQHEQRPVGDAVPYSREVTYCDPNGQCQKYTLAPGQPDPRHQHNAETARSKAQPSSDKCKLIEAQKKGYKYGYDYNNNTNGGNGHGQGHGNGNGDDDLDDPNSPEARAVLRPRNRRLAPYTENIVPKDPYN